MNTDLIYTIIAVVVPLVELLGILAAIHAILNARTSQSAIAWAISLITIPWLALILYAILGRNKFKGYVLLRNSKDQDIHHYIDQIQKEAVSRSLIREDLSASEKSLSRLADMTITRYNKSRLLIDGYETFRSIFKGIESAERYILVQFYVINNDDIGRQLQNKLIKMEDYTLKSFFFRLGVRSARLLAPIL